MTDAKARHHRQEDLTYTYHTALSQVFYTAQYPALQGADKTYTPGYWQHHALYWLLMKKDKLKACFPETYRMHYESRI